MLRCWCHAAMRGWLGSSSWDVTPSPQAMLRWRTECERAGGDCPARLEAVALRLPDAQALRQGHRLTLSTQQGPVVYQDTEGAEGVSHRYLGRIAAGERHLLWRRGPLAPRGEFLAVCHASARVQRFEHLQQALTHPGCEGCGLPSTPTLA